MNKCILLFLLFSAALALTAVEIIQNGSPKSEIVISPKADPSVRTAAKELQKYLKKISGAELSVVEKPGSGIPIYVGESEYTKKLGVKLSDLKDDGYKIIIGDRYVVLAGVDQCRPPIPRGNTDFGYGKKMEEDWKKYTGKDWDYPRDIRDPRNFSKALGFHIQDANGTLYAVYEFLEMLGMRWFMPVEELGVVVPEKKTIDISPAEIRKEPRMGSRNFLLVGIGNNPTEFLWYKSLRLGGSFDLFASHSSELVYHYGDPEMTTFSGGKPVSIGLDRRTRRPRYVPRIGSQKLRGELIEYLVKFHDAYPEIPYLPIGIPDGWNVMDERDVAAGWDRKGEGADGRFSDYAWDFICDVAKQVHAARPETKFRTSSYGYAKNPPRGIEKIPADIGINLVQSSTIPGSFQKDMALRSEWIRKAPDSDFFIYDYYTYHAPTRQNPPVPVVFTPLMAESYSSLPPHCRGIYIELPWSWPRKNNLVLGLPGINHLMLYLSSKFMWDQNPDVNAILTDYYDKFFGPAKDEMREFYEYAQKVWMRPEQRQLTVSGGFLKAENVTKYFEILDRAKAKAGDGIYGKRIDFIRSEMESLKNLFAKLDRTGYNVRIPTATGKPEKIDGDLDKDFWTRNKEKRWMVNCVSSIAPRNNKTSVMFYWSPAEKSLYAGITCYEENMAGIHAKTPENTRDEQGIYSDDTIELHLETPEGKRAVIVVNPNGAVRDVCNTSDAAEVPEAWNVEKVAVKKLKDRWTVELKIGSLGEMPTKASPWGFNVFRLRRAGGKPEPYAICATGKGFINASNKMGNLYVK